MESKSAILQSDGKIIVVGITQNTAISNLFDLFLLRFNNNGSLDSSFGLDGSVEADIDSTSDVAYDIAIQSDEKILITGNTTIEPNSTAGSDIFVMRYNNDGSVDNSFASSGISIIDFNSNNDYAHSIILQADGQILVAGNTDDTTQKVLLLRLTSLGWVDSTFSEDGIATTYVNNTLQSDAFAGNFASSAILQSDGKIVIVGTAQISFYDYAFLVERLFLDSKVGIIDLQAFEIASYVLYPNPLSNHCYFSYEITQPENVNLQLTDLAGQTMRIFFNEKKTDGKHTEQLSLDGISSGVYLLQLSTDKEIVSVKIVKQ
jgi:uncharacterized delta-60 repeat protein